MADLGSRAAVDAVIDALLNNGVPDESITADLDNALRKDILDTLTGLKNTLREANITDGYNIDISSGDAVRWLDGAFNGAIGVATLGANRTYTLPDKSGTFAMLSDIPSVSGTTNRYSKFTGASTIGNALMIDDGVKIYTTIGGFSNAFASFWTNTLDIALGSNNAMTGADATGFYGAANGSNAGFSNIGGFFQAVNGGTNYALRLVDGSQAATKILTSVTANGHTQWQYINDFTTDSSPDRNNDYLLSYDASAGTHKKVTLGNAAANLANTDLAINQASRTVNLNGNTSGEKLEFLTLSGNPLITLRGDGKLAFLTSSFSTSDISVGDVSNAKGMSFYCESKDVEFLDTDGRFLRIRNSGTTRGIEITGLDLTSTMNLGWVSGEPGTSMAFQTASTTVIESKNLAGTTFFLLQNRASQGGTISLRSNAGVEGVWLTGGSHSYIINNFAIGKNTAANARLDVIAAGDTSGNVAAWIRNLSGDTVIKALGDRSAEFGGRLKKGKGANVASSNDLTLGYDGNCFSITGTTQINAITTTGWSAGNEIVLIFSDALTLKHNTTGGGSTAVINLSGSLDLLTAAGTLIGLVYDGTVWQETFRKTA